LERLADPEREGRRTISEDTQTAVHSVMRNLQRLLNSRRGQALIQPDYGLPDITDCVENAPEALDRVSRAIKSTIEVFEPRLRRVRITHFPVANDLNLHFGISGEIITETEQIPVHFNTTVNPTGSAVIAAGEDFAELEVGDHVKSYG
jgi:type VI secretion system protein